ncbi:unnamed protein product [Nezara viridula]|uniref:Uncharacterized protein n=1 Tax=Nezara viridula TaxID=85310 RepID=A0A9P0H414_NEZVI|nr:unnamed protein product [Nezara viridula]
MTVYQTDLFMVAGWIISCRQREGIKWTATHDDAAHTHSNEDGMFIQVLLIVRVRTSYCPEEDEGGSLKMKIRTEREGHLILIGPL